MPTRGNQVRVIVWALLLTLTPFGVASAPSASATTIVTLSDTDALSFDYSKTANIKGNGKTAGDVVLYRNVGVFGGVSIDAVVTTISVSGSISVYDNPGSASSAAGSLNNFMLNTVGGSVQVQFEFFISGSYTVVGSGSPVILQNVKITSIDLDSLGTSDFQYSEFTGFQGYQMTADTNLLAQPLSGGAGARFIAGKSGNRSAVPQDQVLIKYTTVSTLKVTFGNVISGSTNYFGLVFGTWPGTGTPIEYPNVFNTAPTSSSTSLYVPATATTTIPKSAFGNYTDVDNNPFVSIKVSALPAQGTVQLNGANIAANQVISIADIEAGKLKLVSSSLATSPVLSFYVFDGLDYSTSAYNLTFVPAGAAQTIRFTAPGSQTTGVTLASGATSTSGLTVTLTSNTPGICSISGLDITTLANGTCEVTATQAGNASFAAALPVTVSFPVSSGSAQTITFGNPGTQIVGTPYTAAPTAAPSGLQVLLTSTTPSICTVSGFVVTFLSSGVCTLVASQAGNVTYAPAANVTQSFTVNAPSTSSVSIAARTTGVGLTGSSSYSSRSGTTSYSGSGVLYGRIDMNGNSSGVTWQFCYSRSSTQSSAGALNSTGTTSSTKLYCGSKTQSFTSTSSSYSSKVDSLTAGTANDAEVSSITITGLSSSSTTYYQLIAWPTGNTSAKVYGQILTIKNTAPYARTTSATNTTTSSATLNGNVMSSDTNTAVSYCLSKTLSFASNKGDMNCDLTFSAYSRLAAAAVDTATPYAVTGLSTNTKYYYQVIANKTTGGVSTIDYANVVSFTTNAADPIATTTQVTSLGSSSATLNGSVLSQGPTTNAKFCYGTAADLTGCTSVTATPSTASGAGGTSISYNLSGLTPGTKYYYRAVASRAGSAVNYNGSIVSFIPGAPLATTLGASSISSGWNATLNGYVTTYGQATNVTFCYGTSAAVDSGTGKLSTCTSVAATVPQVSSNSSATVSLSSLTSNTTYFFQVVAANNTTASLITYGSVLNFITASAPAVTTVAADSVTATTGNLKGLITANGASTVGSFCLSTSSTVDPDSGALQTCIANPTNVATVASNGSGVAFNYFFTNLTTATTYYFQATAENARGTTTGSVLSFSTSTLPIAITSAASSVAATSATLNGSAAANTGTNTTVKFCYAASATQGGGDLITDSSGRITSPSPTCAAANTTTLTGNSVTTFSQPISGLTATAGSGGSTYPILYYFQLQVSNANNSAYGAVFTFTLGISTVTTDTATAITSTSATVSGTASKLSSDANVSSYMCISNSNAVDVNGMLSCNVDQQVSATSVGTSNIAVSYSSTALRAGNTYYYQAILNSDKSAASGAPVVGSVLSFTTNPQVTFNGNGSTSGTTASKNATVGTTSALTSNGFSRTRYTFAGWGTTAETSTVAYSNGANFVFNSNTTLYALWTFNGFIVSFNANGGSGAAMADQQSNSAANLTSNTYTYTGFNFDGWATTPTGTQAYANSASYGFTADAVLYARWVATGHQIRFIGNGATGGSMSMQAVPDATNTALRANAFTRTGGYTFTGWTETSTSTTVEFADSATVNTTVDMTLYAIWTTANKVVTFDANASDATGSMTAQTAATAGALTANSFAREKYTFMGWSETATAVSAQYANSASFPFDRDIYLYALWAGRVTYDGNGADAGTSGPTDVTYYFDGQSATIIAPSGFTKSGLTLIGWATTPTVDASSQIYTTGSIAMAGNITLYAVWAARVTYSAPDLTSGSVPTDTVDYLPGTEIYLASGSGITRTDWTFEGWTAGATTLHPGSDTFKLDQNTTLRAVWSTSLFSYAITLNDNGDPANETVQNGYTSSNIRLIANPFTKSGYTFGGWSTLDTATASEYSDRGYVTVPNDAFAITLYAIWTLTPTPPAPPAPPSGGGGGGGGAPAPTPTASPTPTPTPTVTPSAAPKPSTSTSAAPKPSPVPTLKPVITGTVTTVVTPKTIKPNSIVTLTQVVKVSVPTSVTVQSISVNGVSTQTQNSTPAPTPSRSPSAGSTPSPTATKAPTGTQEVSSTSSTVVGPDDNVKVNATDNNGQKVQAAVQIEKVDPFTLANVNFDFGSAKLTPAAKKILDQVAAVVIDHGFNLIQLTGHTDVLASAGYSNQALSDQRAATVRAYLAKKLAGEGVVVQSLGLAAKEPVIAKTDAASRALNRRVEIGVASK